MNYLTSKIAVKAQNFWTIFRILDVFWTQLKYTFHTCMESYVSEIAGSEDVMTFIHIGMNTTPVIDNDNKAANDCHDDNPIELSYLFSNQHDYNATKTTDQNIPFDEESYRSMTKTKARRLFLIVIFLVLIKME